MNEVFINKASKFLPNSPVENEDVEEYLGYVNGEPSKSKNIVLRLNGIKKRYYALDKGGKATHTNAEMTANAVKNLFNEHPEELGTIDLLACGTSSPDQLMPSHAVMVHGNLPETSNIEVISAGGNCCSGMHALKYAFMSLKLGEKEKAVCAGSERTSVLMTSNQFEAEVKKKIEALNEDHYIGFEKDFLRWMLSDGAGAMLLETEKKGPGLSLKIEWIESCSFAHQVDTCMYQGGDKLDDGTFQSYRDYDVSDLLDKSLLSIKQDTNLLKGNIVPLGNKMLLQSLKKHNVNTDELTYFLPHLSSFVFKNEIVKTLKQAGVDIPEEKWFTNLATVGNVGAGSMYLMIEELLKSDKLKKGDKLLLLIPESARFSYVISYMTVC
jgi:3-oxoacyl-[acyl-carrier-protein] synthase-3